MPTSFTVRELNPGEAGVFRQLLGVFGTVFEDAATYIDHQPRDAYLSGLLGSEAFIALTAIEGDTVIAGLTAYELKKFEQERSEIYIYDLAVSEAYRRRGVATSLIGYLKSIASQRGAWVIYVQADHTDPPAIALYSKLGKREDILHFDIQPDMRK